MKLKAFIFGCVALFSVSCTMMFGVKPSISEEFCTKFISKIDTEREIMDMDVKSYTFFLKNEIDSTHLKHFYQPLQVLTFVDGTLFSHSVNCNAGGFPNLQWNIQVQDDCKLSGNTAKVPPLKIEDYLFAIDNNSSHKTKMTDDVVVIVHVSCFMGRQTSRLIEIIEQLDLKCTVLYVNNSSLYLEK